MTSRRKTVSWLVVIASLGVALTVALIALSRSLRPITLQGAVVTQDSDPDKQLPITDVSVSVTAGNATVGEGKSDASGFFKLSLSKGARLGQLITLRFQHPNYEPLVLPVDKAAKLYIAHLVPIRRQMPAEASHPEILVANVRVRYSVKSTSAGDVGSGVKTFRVVNTGNLPCSGHPPCSPDGKWKAATGSASLEAGEGNEFRNARVSCIAGPCPFTKIDSDEFSQGGRQISVSVRNWSDTTTFLLEAEVVHPMVSDTVRESYPVIFGPALNFSLPATAEGPSIEAEIDGETIIFPLGPDLFLSWATCNVRGNGDQTKAYRCELKPGYRFR
ncbi:MAG: hypothetical protein WB421_16640 [Terriglobales bacterium]